MLEIILVQGFSLLKTKITPFPHGGFRPNVSKQLNGMLVFQTSPVGVELFSLFFCSNTFTNVGPVSENALISL